MAWIRYDLTGSNKVSKNLKFIKHTLRLDAINMPDTDKDNRSCLMFILDKKYFLIPQNLILLIMRCYYTFKTRKINKQIDSLAQKFTLSFTSNTRF